MGARKAVTPQTLEAVATEIAGESFGADKTAEQAKLFETIMQMIETLRDLPIKDVEPAVTFQPVESVRKR
jgi:Asp-tRNA(Asn)/Glu-tRNA(Gln) amidotransferase C subunit